MLQNKPWNKAPQLEQFQFQTSVYIGRPRKKWKGSRGSKKNDSKEGIPIHPKDFILPRFALFDFKKTAPLENYRRVCGGNFIFVTLLSNEICELLQINGLVAAVCPKKRNHRTRTSQHFATNEGEKKTSLMLVSLVPGIQPRTIPLRCSTVQAAPRAPPCPFSRAGQHEPKHGHLAQPPHRP